MSKEKPYKERFKEAVKHVSAELSAMTEEEFKIELKKHENDPKTLALLYAWDPEAAEKYGIEKGLERVLG